MILCSVRVSGEGWAEKLPPRTRYEFVVASFLSAISHVVMKLRELDTKSFIQLISGLVNHSLDHEHLVSRS